MIRPSVLLGFSDFFDEVGAPVKPTAPRKPGAPPPPRPTGPRPPQPSDKSFGSAKQTGTVKKHAQILARAKKTLFKAARQLGRAQVALAKRPPVAVTAAASKAMKTAAVKATAAKAASTRAAVAPSPAATRTATVARGAAARAIVGAVGAMVQAKKPVSPVVAKNLSPKAKAAIAKHNAAVAASKKAAQVLAQHAMKGRKSVRALAKAAINQKKVSKLLRTKGGKVQVGDLLGHSVIGHGVAEALGEYYESVGAAPDPYNPGYLDDGSPDPAYADPALMDPGYAPTPSDPLLSESEIAPFLEDEEDPMDNINAAQGWAPMPLDAPTVPDYKQVGGVLYNESKGRPNGFMGSYNLFSGKLNQYEQPSTAAIDGTNRFGYVWGKFDREDIPLGLPWGGNFQENSWNRIAGYHNTGLGPDWHWTATPEEALASVTKEAHGVVYGPLVGNPGMPDFKGMRVDGQGNLFWYPQEAPEWLVAPLKQAAALTESKMKQAEIDAEKQYQLELEKQRRDAAAQQAAQDAANALAESQAASETRVTEQQAQAQQATEATAQAQQETSYQQMQVEQAREEGLQQQQAQAQLLEQARAEAAAEQQAQQILLQRAQRQEQLMAETPELEAALMVQDAGLLEEGAAEEGGEEAAAEEEPSYEDTTAYSEPEAESDNFRHPIQDDDYEASGFEDGEGFDDSGEDLVF